MKSEKSKSTSFPFVSSDRLFPNARWEPDQWKNQRRVSEQMTGAFHVAKQETRTEPKSAGWKLKVEKTRMVGRGRGNGLAKGRYIEGTDEGRETGKPVRGR